MDIIGSFDNIESVTKIETRYYKKIMLAKYSTQQQFFIYTTLRHVWDIHYTSIFDFIRGCEWLKLLHIPGSDTYLFMLLNISPFLPKNYYNYVVFYCEWLCILCAGLLWLLLGPCCHRNDWILRSYCHRSAQCTLGTTGTTEIKKNYIKESPKLDYTLVRTFKTQQHSVVKLDVNS